jgi:hypothetical protein
MKTLQMEEQQQREVDWSDCLAILGAMIAETGKPVSRQGLQEFD